MDDHLSISWTIERRMSIPPNEPYHITVLLPYDGFSNPRISIPTYPSGPESVKKALRLAHLIAASPKLAAACWMFTVCTAKEELEAARALAIEALNEAEYNLDGDDMKGWFEQAKKALASAEGRAS